MHIRHSSLLPKTQRLLVILCLHWQVLSGFVRPLPIYSEIVLSQESCYDRALVVRRFQTFYYLHTVIQR
uniref:Secreted protein n=1 Tax=Anguilla anguilla TaxID=7936 RepID=A0A0E9WEM1_ANGAN